MNIPQFKSSKRFLGEFAVPCLVAKIKNADVPGLATQHLAQFKKNPKMEIWLRVQTPEKMSDWMRAQLDALFAKNGLTAVVAEGIKQLGSEEYDFHVEEAPFLKQHGLVPYIYVERVVVDEVEQRVVIKIADRLYTFAEHGGFIYNVASEWRLGDYNDYSHYAATLEKYRIDPYKALKARQKKKLDALFPQPASDVPAETGCSSIYGRWEIDEAETNKLLKQIGEEPFSTGALLGDFYTFHATYIEPHREDSRITGWQSRGNWFSPMGSSLKFWFDGQQLVEWTLLDEGYTCRVYRKATEWKFNDFALNYELPLPGAEGLRYLISIPVPYCGILYVARESSVDIVDNLQAKQVKYARVRPSFVNAKNFSYFAAISAGRICGLSSTEGKVSLMDPKLTEFIISTAKTGKTPVGLLFLSKAEELYVFNDGDSSATVYEVKVGFNEEGRPIDGLRLKQTIHLPAEPAVAATCDNELGYVYCSLKGRNEIAVINAKSHSVQAVWPVAGGEGPFSLAADFQFRRLFVNCANKRLLMLDGETGKIVASIPVGEGGGSCLFDDARRLLFSIAGDGLLTIARLETPEKLAVVQTLRTDGASHTIATHAYSGKLVLLKKGLRSGGALLVYSQESGDK